VTGRGASIFDPRGCLPAVAAILATLPSVCNHRSTHGARDEDLWLKKKLNTYAGYSISCATVWAVILAVAQRRLDPETRNTVWLVCGGWWTGWTSATIARAGYPPPRKLTPDAERRLGMVSLPLVAMGLISVIRLLATGKQPAKRGGG
jgi:hypothetical protein